MRAFTIIASMFLIAAHCAFAQPMTGNYTVGGSSPDFATLQDAANAIKSRGVSGPVFINIRPGTYTRDGGASRLFVLDSTIGGVSATNRITIQPDAGSGGNVDNVILQANFNSSSNPRILATVHTDYTTIRNLTFKDADSMDIPVFTFIDAGFDTHNALTDGLEVDGCKFIGTPYFPQFGTDIGFGSAQNVQSAAFTRNRFYRICRAITNVNAGRGGTFIVEDNEFYQGYLSSTGSGNPIGTAIELACTHASIRRNIIDLAGGRGAKSGIEIIFATSAIIERNLIKNRVPIGDPFDAFTGIWVRNPFTPPDSITIVNNAVVADRATVRAYCVNIEAANTKVLYNTMVNASGVLGANIALSVTGANCTVLNNIILEQSDASFVAFDQGNSGQSPNLVSDYNIIFLPEGHGAFGLVRRNGTMFTSLPGYQAGTGLDSHSVSKFINFSDGFHLDTCQAQDPDLNGIPIRGITQDYDGARRDSVKPFKGADESVRLPFDMFADGFRAGLSGTPFSLAAGDFFDHDNDDDIAVPDYDNRRISLFRNQRPTRSFVQSGTVFTNVQPGVIKLFDFDEDGHLDLIVGGDTAAVDVFWGDGGGGFGPRVTVETFGRVRSIEPEPFRNRSDGATIWITEDNGFSPNTGFLGSIICFAGRQLCHDITYRSGQFGGVHDTIPATLTALAAADIDTTRGYEVIALSIAPLPSRFFEFVDLSAIYFSTPCSPGYYNSHTGYQFGTGSYLGFGSNIIIGDFDIDGDKDLISTSASENTCMLIRNLGNVLLTVGDTIPTTQTRAIVALDYEGDGDLDFIAANRTLYDHGITVLLNDGQGHFTPKPNCFFPFASGFPNGMVASDFDRDGKTDIAIVSSFDSLFVLYNLGGFNGTTGVEEHAPQQLPTEISLAQNYPNPFNPSTRIEYKLPLQSHVTLKIYNILGQEVATLLDEEQDAGSHVVRWNGQNSSSRLVSSGVYFYRVEVKPVGGQPSFAGVKKMILIR